MVAGNKIFDDSLRFLRRVASVLCNPTFRPDACISIKEDFDLFTKLGLSVPEMEEIKAELGI